MARVSRCQLHQVNMGRLPEWRFCGDESHELELPLEGWQALAGRAARTTSSTVPARAW